MKIKIAKSFPVQIYMAGDIHIVKQICRKYCMDVGFCVTITKTNYIYTGGEELGVCIGLINYPRFPESEKDILNHAINLGKKLMIGAYQHSLSIQTPNKTIWLSRRKNG